MRSLLLIASLGCAIYNFSNAQSPTPFTFDEFMGVNTLRDMPNDANPPVLSCVGFVREFHDWNADEGNWTEQSAYGDAEWIVDTGDMNDNGNVTELVYAIFASDANDQDGDGDYSELIWQLAEICDNCIDDDGDGFTDCEDQNGNTGCFCGSMPYPNNRYSWNDAYQGTTQTAFDDFYGNMSAQGLGISAALKNSLRVYTDVPDGDEWLDLIPIQ